jgi:catechol 2,3-dioxygenase-like lactoylglutathione lyase family enzyme
MVRLDHMTLPVGDWRAARDWWRDILGFEVEFEIPERNTVALKDGADLTVFFTDGTPVVSAEFSFAIQVDDVEAKYAELSAKGIKFVNAPQKLFWGYGAELKDPNGYLLGLWDPVSMKAKGGG